MAQGTLTTFTEAKLHMSDGTYELATVDDWSVMLITTLPVVGQAAPDTGLYTEVSGDNYSADGQAMVTTLSADGLEMVFDCTADITWTEHATGPDNVVAALIYSETAVATNALAFIDMTQDAGGNPISFREGKDVLIKWADTGILRY